MKEDSLNKIVLAGGSGYLGIALASYFMHKAKEIVILTRQVYPKNKLAGVRYVKWNGKEIGIWQEELNGCDLLINLTGKSVNCRYTKSNRTEILESRLNSVNVLGAAIKNCSIPPKHFIQLASSTIYRHSEDKAMTEDNGELGEGFSVNVCRQWEQAFTTLEVPTQTIKTLLRVAIVYGAKDGVFTRLRNLVTLGMGGMQGKGTQYISWIHERDFCRMVEWVFDERLDGLFNVASPQPMLNKEHMALLVEVMGAPIAVSQPEWLLEIGARLIGTETELLLKSRYVIPQRALTCGFQFSFPHLKEAFIDLMSQRR